MNYVCVSNVGGIDNRPSTLRPTNNGYQPGRLLPIGNVDDGYNRPTHSGGTDNRPSTLRPTNVGYQPGGLSPNGNAEDGYNRPTHPGGADNRPSTLRPSNSGYQAGGLSPNGNAEDGYNRPTLSGGADSRPGTLRPTNNGQQPAGLSPSGNGNQSKEKNSTQILNKKNKMISSIFFQIFMITDLQVVATLLKIAKFQVVIILEVAGSMALMKPLDQGQMDQARLSVNESPLFHVWICG